ncbi:MAG: hypothetical protein QNK23_02925 [Crocinitomicaceae bacterium]|nr:hypothetical protein [Crocinitomicaceae bacterium]
MKESKIQRLVGFFSSKSKKEAIKQESMLWGFTCENCKKRSSIWEIGGVRYKAKGNPRTMIKCPECGTKVMQRITKIEA